MKKNPFFSFQEAMSVTLLLVIALLLYCCVPKKAPGESNEISFTSSSENALKEFNKGLDLLDVGNDQQAREYFNKAIELDPDFASAYLFRSFTSRTAAEFKQDSESAVAKMEKTNEAEKLLINIGKTFLSDDADQRLELSKQLATSVPSSARACENLGSVYQGRNDVNAARECFQKAIALNPKWVGGYLALGGSYLFVAPKDFKKAEENFIKASEIKPSDSRIELNLGNSYRAQNNLEKAREHYAKATQVNSQDPNPLMALGHVNSYLGNYDEARKNYQDARKLDSPGAITFEGFTYLYAGDYKAALAFLDEQMKALDQSGLKPDRISQVKINCLDNCRWIAFHHKEAAKVKEYNEMAGPLESQISNDIGTQEAKQNGQASLIFWDGLQAAMGGDFKTAEAKATENMNALTTVKNPRKLDNYHFLAGYVALKQGKFGDAITHFEQSFPNDVYLKFLLMQANEGVGNKDKAMEIFNSIVDFNFNTTGYALVRKELKERKI